MSDDATASVGDEVLDRMLRGGLPADRPPWRGAVPGRGSRR
ncbi:hypothetical protein ACFQRB_13980 [Halobaculum litoreum]|uniref:Uncharacterized protein n=1 Tax=Halobaculum litoreum TaxID=3031998 RepID=A0ABD5XQ73_9EURY